MNPVLSTKNISKQFGTVKALNDITVDFYPGETHALMGENGAGKSTLVKILFGLYSKDEGEVIYQGETVNYSAPIDALKDGIAMVHQELSVIEERTVAENIFLGKEPLIKGTRFIDTKAMNLAAKDALSVIGVEDINPRSKVKDLDIAKKQLVDIAKAVSYNPKVIIFDEATSSLDDKETNSLFTLIEKIKAKGTAIIYITHKLEEVFRITDKVTIMRDGNLITTKKTTELTKDEMITLMVNREIKDVYPKVATDVGNIALEIRDFVNVKNNASNSFSVRHGEIVGMAGLVGAGRTELVESIFGLRKDYAGTVLIDGKPVSIRKPKDAINNHIALITEDRKLTGLNLKATVRENISIVTLKDFCKAGLLNKKKEHEVAKEQIDKLSIKTPSDTQKVSNLSGGNQQKVVIAKWLLSKADIIIMDEPTRGIDVGAKREIYQLMCTLKQEGKAIIMISSELPELIGMCDRMIVMHANEITGILSGEEITQENIMAKAIGAKEDE